MRTLFVVETLEVAQALELLAQARGWWIGGLLQQCQMHALMPAVLLRLARRNALRNHAGLDQLDRQLRQSAGTARGKRRSVVGTHVMRQAELAERRIQHRPDMVGIRARQPLAAQQIAAMGIGDRQRLAAPAVAGQETTLEVDAPHIVAAPQCAKGALEGGLRRRSFRFTVNPSRSNNDPIVLAAGQSLAG